MSIYVGRKKELQRLEDLWNKTTPSLVVLKGRRRIGKSRLAKEFSKQNNELIFTGHPPSGSETNQSQLDLFMFDLCRWFQLPEFTVDNWTKAFQLLFKHLPSEKTVLVFDEISWMGSKDPDFMGKLKTAWDVYFKESKNLIFILSGSVSSWIEKNILSSTGFLGRLSLVLDLKELSLKESVQLLSNNGIQESNYNTFKLLAVTGGIPRYLEEILPNKTAEMNIRDLCFSSSGILFREFEDIFSDLFDRRKDFYKKIVLLLSQGSKDLSHLCEGLGLKMSGDILEYMNHLIQSGFVSRDYTWSLSSGKTSKLSVFRISDNYVRFYVKYILPNKAGIEKGAFEEASLSKLPAYTSVMGLQFENLVLNNRSSIWEHLHIAKEDIVCDGPFFQRKTKTQEGCQIDYMIQTKFNTLYVCEIKFNDAKQSVVQEVQEKIKRLKIPKHMSVRPVLIHLNDAFEDEFFFKTIDFTQLLEA